MQRVLKAPGDIRLLFLSCWITYFLCYMGRVNYGIVIVEIVSGGVLAKPEAGLVSTGAFFAYGAGQLFSGLLSGKFSPKSLMLTGILASALCNLGMFFAGTLPVMLCLWVINGFAQSLLWAPIMKMFSEYLTRSNGVRSNTHFSSSPIVSTMATAGFCSLTVSALSWRYVFLFSAGLMLAAAAVFGVGIAKIEGRLAAADEEVVPQDAAPVGKFSYRALFAASAFIVILLGTVIQGILKDGVSTWIPTLLSERFDIMSHLSILIMAVMPLTNLAGIYAASYASEKIFRNEITAAALFFAVTGLSAAGVLLLKGAGLAVTVVLLSLLTASVAGINLILVGLVPMRFSKWKIAAVISGFMNFLTYFGSALSGYGFGSVSARYGWNTVILIWLGLSGTGCLIFFIIAKSGKDMTKKIRRSKAFKYSIKKAPPPFTVHPG